MSKISCVELRKTRAVCSTQIPKFLKTYFRPRRNWIIPVFHRCPFRRCFATAGAARCKKTLVSGGQRRLSMCKPSLFCDAQRCPLQNSNVSCFWLTVFLRRLSQKIFFLKDGIFATVIFSDGLRRPSETNDVLRRSLQTVEPSNLCIFDLTAANRRWFAAAVGTDVRRKQRPSQSTPVVSSGR